MSFISKSLSAELKDELINTGGWNEYCPVSLDRLKLVEVIFSDFAGSIREGKLICLDVVSSNVINIFKNLLEAGFAINSVKLLSEFGYDDDKSMNANNSSCFNNRFISGTNRLSLHAYGLALDINPEQNPMLCLASAEENYINAKIYPSSGKDFMNRMLLKQGMVESFVENFFNNGFDVWGGLWQSPIDYHHFEVNRELAQKLVTSPQEQSEQLWLNHLQNCR
jgi:hypothetical protein